ncbi:MAG: anhydro-N-acetylmuramic acid kinase [Caldilineaceae bacterium]
MRIIGMISGTSVDGIDVAVADITNAPHSAALQIEQLAFLTVPWEGQIRHEIFTLFDQATTAAALCRANFGLGEHFAAALLQTLEATGIPLASIDLIGSHGQTLWHDVNADGHVTSTLQLGDPSVIAARTGVTTIGNFRVADVAVGGQGAPLVSTFDWHLLRPLAQRNGVKSGWRAVQNIGGIGNVTFLPPLNLNASPLAFDTGPGNALIDWAAGLATDGQRTFDRDGMLATQGQVHTALVEQWLTLPYFQQPPPKTTGRELFGQQLARQWWSAAAADGLSAHDFVATVTELTAASIAKAYADYAPAPVDEVVVGGGGARNPVLLARLEYHLAQRLPQPVTLCTHQALGIDDKAKEALAFALLAFLAIHGHAGNVPACTGATQEQILGQIAPGRNYHDLQQRIHYRSIPT